jgi:hypothetical protein
MLMNFAYSALASRRMGMSGSKPYDVDGIGVTQTFQKFSIIQMLLFRAKP